MITLANNIVNTQSKSYKTKSNSSLIDIVEVISMWAVVATSIILVGLTWV